MTNAIIRGFRLKDLLNILDARASIAVFTQVGEAAIVGAVSPVKVYELLANEEFIKTYGNKEVSGLVSFINVTNILIEEA